MELDPANTPAQSIWEWRIKTARPPTIIIKVINLNQKGNKHMPTTTAKITSTKSLNLDIAKSRSEMRGRIINHIRAGYPGLYLVSHEEQRVNLEMKAIAQELKYNLVMWSAVDGLVDTGKRTSTDANDPLEALLAVKEMKEKTIMRVQSVRQEIAAAGSEQERTGIFTTSIISKTGQRQIALFFTGQKHAGENLNQLLQRRAAGLDQPMQMCDALSRNEPQEFQTLICNCILHARRNFIDLSQSFPEECRHVIESLRDIYRFEAQAKEGKLSPLERLHFHQEQSKPVMDQLREWMQAQLDQKKVEPNSGLGDALNYMLKRWETLTRFLSVPGAPLDNNIAERGLKMAILHRKTRCLIKRLRGPGWAIST